MAATSILPRLRPPLPLSSLRSVSITTSASATPPVRLRPPRISARPLLPSPPSKKRVSGDANANLMVEVEEEEGDAEEAEEKVATVGAETPGLPSPVGMARAGLGDQVFFLLAFVAVTTSVAFVSMVAVAIPTLLALRRASVSFTKLADTALEELPSTMAAVRLSGMEISDLTLELSELSQEIADGVDKSVKVVKAVEDGIGQMSTLARQHTMSMIEERANLSTIPAKLAFEGAARRTSHIVEQATKSLMNLLSGNDNEGKEQLSDRMEF